MRGVRVQESEKIVAEASVCGGVVDPSGTVDDWATIPWHRGIEEFCRRVPIVELRSASDPQHNCRGPKSSLKSYSKRLSIFVFPRL